MVAAFLGLVLVSYFSYKYLFENQKVVSGSETITLTEDRGNNAGLNRDADNNSNNATNPSNQGKHNFAAFVDNDDDDTKSEAQTLDKTSKPEQSSNIDKLEKPSNIYKDGEPVKQQPKQKLEHNTATASHSMPTYQNKEANTNVTHNEVDRNDVVDTQVYIKPQSEFIDTLRIYDTIVYYDTLIVEARKSNKNSSWSLTPGISIFSTIPNVKSNADNAADFAAINSNATSASVSYSFGAEAHYNRNNWRLSTGLAYTTLYENFEYQTTKIESKKAIKYKLKQNGFYNRIVERVDFKIVPKQNMLLKLVESSYTIRRIEYPEYILVDTLWRKVYDTTYVQVMDSVKILSYDTIRVTTYDTTYYEGLDTSIYTNTYQNINKYSYLELPLTVGYGIKFNKLTLRPTVGAVLGFMINAKGKGISALDKNVVYNLENSELPFMNIQVTAYVGLGLEYQIRNGLDLYVQPFYRRNLTSIYQSSAILQKRFTGFGARLGLTYRF